jgi:transcriptional regulator with XRE-family HTH domain
MSDVNFGVRLAELRRAKGWSQEALARAAGLSTSAVSKAENSGVDVSWSTAVKLADALGVSLDQFRSAPGPRKKR